MSDYCSSGHHDWSQPAHLQHDGLILTAEACVECCATRITAPNGINLIELLELEPLRVHRHLTLVEDES